MSLRVTPVWIDSLGKNEVLVYDSNLAASYNTSIGRLALKFGAVYKKYYGMSGDTFAIPTKDRKLRALPLDDIDIYVEGFLIAAKQNRDRIFMVTEIGCGAAGYKPWEIAPMFERAVTMRNVYLPDRFLKILLNKGR